MLSQGYDGVFEKLSGESRAHTHTERERERGERTEILTTRLSLYLCARHRIKVFCAGNSTFRLIIQFAIQVLFVCDYAIKVAPFQIWYF